MIGHEYPRRELSMTVIIDLEQVHECTRFMGEWNRSQHVVAGMLWIDSPSMHV